LDRVGAETDENKRRQIKQTRRYLLANADGLGDGPSLGTIESNVDKLVANRMKKRGMAWTKAGARRMLKLLEKRAKDDFDDILASKPQIAVEREIAIKTVKYKGKMREMMIVYEEHIEHVVIVTIHPLKKNQKIIVFKWGGG